MKNIIAIHEISVNKKEGTIGIEWCQAEIGRQSVITEA